MAKVIEKGYLGEYFEKLEQMCEEKGLVPIIMDNVRWNINVKDKGDKNLRGLHIKPDLLLSSNGFKNEKADVRALHTFMTIGLLKEDQMSQVVIDLRDGKDTGQQTLEDSMKETDTDMTVDTEIKIDDTGDVCPGNTTYEKDAVEISLEGVDYDTLSQEERNKVCREIFCKNCHNSGEDHCSYCEWPYFEEKPSEFKEMD